MSVVECENFLSRMIHVKFWLRLYERHVLWYLKVLKFDFSSWKSLNVILDVEHDGTCQIWNKTTTGMHHGYLKM